MKKRIAQPTKKGEFKRHEAVTYNENQGAGYLSACQNLDGQFKDISAAFYQYPQGLHGLGSSGKRIGHRIRYRITTLLVDFTCTDPG
jgi:hypothetical protein